MWSKTGWVVSFWLVFVFSKVANKTSVLPNVNSRLALVVRVTKSTTFQNRNCFYMKKRLTSVI